MRKTICLSIFIILFVMLCNAEVERVLLVNIIDFSTTAIIQRQSGIQYKIVYGVGVIGLPRYINKYIYINSPGIFAGVGSEIVLPDTDQKARIWSSEILIDDNIISSESSNNYSLMSNIIIKSYAGNITLRNSTKYLIDFYINSTYCGSVKAGMTINVLSVLDEYILYATSEENSLSWGPSKVSLKNEGYLWNLIE